MAYEIKGHKLICMSAYIFVKKDKFDVRHFETIMRQKVVS